MPSNIIMRKGIKPNSRHLKQKRVVRQNKSHIQTAMKNKTTNMKTAWLEKCVLVKNDSLRKLFWFTEVSSHIWTCSIKTEIMKYFFCLFLLTFLPKTRNIYYLTLKTKWVDINLKVYYLPIHLMENISTSRIFQYTEISL